ncbi:MULTISPECIES: LTA synthase family protein [unclassified Pseudomonas]|uniref:LTA synthase family protein n=1 Tax=unclassified Pseudomonas TaxID=196821 RepID=UPI002AC8A9E3|nr:MULTISPECIES: LTA synthase family protein [unclassified Pseudomonas]MEB0039915.1 LTA synthase family protein [Pseudomonas sp. MH10]MEB0077144.1 LTA synthase family protein [Pseudomonas sp. MH10out]MEB0093057.1 LTA synthase family protein [Pseudomonas sp. CCI4.2]MEB0102261.1 LTA synthase family protein [Pseudomonas sp. CCI3.2]MEB0123018.1 LTA synthase family protein [Pseudomonas sp. CCI1.2]
MRAPQTAPVRYLLLLTGTWFAIFLITRAVLLATHLHEAGHGFLSIFGIGAIYDIAFLIYAALPLAFYVLFCPPALWRTRGHRWFLHGVMTVSIFIMLFVSVAEWLFWDEFGVRFNFIAVDYLVYSKEVLNNILESYPIGALLGILAVAAIGLSVVLYKPVKSAVNAPLPKARLRLISFAVLLVLAGLDMQFIDQETPRGEGGNAYQHELGTNGPFQFFAAFRNNELDYKQFFASLPNEEVAHQLRAELAEPNATFVGKDPQDVRRNIANPGTPRTPNIILVTIESLSAKYMGSNGDPHNLTPNLDELRKHSLYFNNFYATGTRTDRGLEAITLSIPPTPGRSIVKRIGRESGYGSLGQQLNAVGYDSVFMYGGRGYFDNMNAFFSGNGYRIVDQSSIKEADIHFKNAWGIADEDLFQQSLNEADAVFAKHTPFFLQLMTTSNHRPYTYPEGRIDIKSGDGRNGSVKYTDWAIGKFLNDARQKPWFSNTIFVFVADHTAGSAGREDLPITNYQIPLFIYAPTLIEARESSQLASQIDLAPTLLGLLNQSYQSTFFGRNLLQDNPLPPRVLVGNYQHLGLFDGTNLAILSPQKLLRRHDQALGESRESRVNDTDPLIIRAISYYQGASYDYKQRLLNWVPGNTAQ